MKPQAIRKPLTTFPRWLWLVCRGYIVVAMLPYLALCFLGLAAGLAQAGCMLSAFIALVIGLGGAIIDQCYMQARAKPAIDVWNTLTTRKQRAFVQFFDRR